MKFFTPAFTKFFKGLEENNHKAWFDEHRKIYQKEIKKPFEDFIQHLINELQAFEPDILLTPREAIFRINRDIRFSKDKTPYKLHSSAALAKGGKKSQTPGYYIQLSHKKVWIGGGCYSLDKENLHKIRSEIAYESEQFNTLINDASFKDKYGELLGERNKILPAEMKEFAKEQPIIYQKQFYFMTELPASLITSGSLAETTLDYFKSAAPINHFLKRAMEDEE